MYRGHYDEAQQYLENEHSFHGLLMATMSKATHGNLEKLREAFPEVAAELKDRDAGNHGPWDGGGGAPRTPRPGEPNYPAKDSQPDGGVYDGGGPPRFGAMGL